MKSDNRLQQIDRQKSFRTRLISVLSGKGGVGKSIIAFNLARDLAAAGRQILLVDADRDGGNLHILANTEPGRAWSEFARGQIELADAVVSVAGHLDLLSPAASSEPEADDAVVDIAILAGRLRQAAGRYDAVIIDHASGVSSSVVSLAGASDIVLLVLVPELTSLADGYGLLKRLLAARVETDLRLLLNRYFEPDEPEYVRRNFTEITRQFLRREPQWWGELPEDPTVRQALASQRAVAEVAPDCPFSRTLTQLSERLRISLWGPDLGGPKSSNETINANLATADTRE